MRRTCPRQSGMEMCLPIGKRGRSGAKRSFLHWSNSERMSGVSVIPYNVGLNIAAESPQSPLENPQRGLARSMSAD